MAKNPYIFRRGNLLYFRISIPLRFRSILKVSELCQTLSQQDVKLAIPTAYGLAGDAHALFIYLDKLMTEKTPIDELLENIESKLSQSKPPVRLTGMALLMHNKKRDLERDFKIEALESDIDSLQVRHKLDIESAVNKAKAESFDKLSSVQFEPISKSKKSPKLSTVIDDYLKRYDPSKANMLRKLKASLPIFLELIGDKPVDEILQNDVNVFFDNAQKLPARRFDEKFKGKSLKQIISLNKGDCISEKTFTGTYVATVSVFLEWAKVHYSDQGFKPLSVKGGLYRGTRSKGINKQRAIKPDELKILFGHEIMKGYVDDPKTAHYCWLPLIGLYTGARINEVCQLNPFTDIVQDADTGIWYFHFTDEGETAFGVDKSIKTKSSIRVVPIHSKLIELGFLDYVKKVGAGGHKIIFPKWAVRNGKASANSTKWFSRYLIDSGLKDETKGAKLIGFHAFRHTFITYASKNKIEGIQAITGHEEGDKKSSVFRGYITKDLTDGLTDKQVMIEKFDFGLELYKPNSKF